MMFNSNRVGSIYFAEFPIYRVIFYSLIEKRKILINNDNWKK